MNVLALCVWLLASAAVANVLNLEGSRGSFAQMQPWNAAALINANANGSVVVFEVRERPNVVTPDERHAQCIRSNGHVPQKHVNTRGSNGIGASIRFL